MKTHVIDKYKPWYSPAYLANGLIGVRAGANPLLQKTALEVGFSGVHEVHAVEAYAPLPAPAIDLLIGRDAMSAMPDCYELLEQAAKKRGFLLSRGEYDIERMANTVLGEYHDGKLGRLSLEVPDA